MIVNNEQEDHKIDDECKWSNDCLSISNGYYSYIRILTITKKILLTFIVLSFSLILGFFATACVFLLFPMAFLVIIPVVILMSVLKGKTIIHIEATKRNKINEVEQTIFNTDNDSNIYQSGRDIILNDKKE